jgi:hypothetical protein
VIILGPLFILGLQCAIEGAYAAKSVGATAASGVITALCDLREVIPYAFGYVMTAKVGAGFVAEIGSMRISDEIEALEVMGFDSILHLGSTRTWLQLPLLHTTSVLVGSSPPMWPSSVPIRLAGGRRCRCGSRGARACDATGPHDRRRPRVRLPVDGAAGRAYLRSGRAGQVRVALDLAGDRARRWRARLRRPARWRPRWGGGAVHRSSTGRTPRSRIGSRPRARPGRGGAKKTK